MRARACSSRMEVVLSEGIPLADAAPADDSGGRDRLAFMGRLPERLDWAAAGAVASITAAMAATGAARRADARADARTAAARADAQTAAAGAGVHIAAASPDLRAPALGAFESAATGRIRTTPTVTVPKTDPLNLRRILSSRPRSS